MRKPAVTFTPGEAEAILRAMGMSMLEGDAPKATLKRSLRKLIDLAYGEGNWVAGLPRFKSGWSGRQSLKSKSVP